MRAYIKKLQSKHEDTRKLIFTGAMVLLMSFVGVVWFYSLGTKFDGDTKAKTNEDIKPFKLFSNSLGDTYKNISASVGQIQKGEDVKRKEEQKQIGLTPVEYVDENGATNPTLIPTTNTNITQ